MARFASKFVRGAVLFALALCLVALPAVASADSFTFGTAGDGRDVHLWGQGRVGEWNWAPITGSNPSPDSITDLFVGFDEWNILEAIGQTSIAVGEYSNLLEQVTMWVVDAANAAGKPYVDSPTNTQLTGAMTITSINVTSADSLTVWGTLSSLNISNTVGSSVLTSLGAASSVDVWFTLTNSGRSTNTLVDAINNGALSSFALLGGGIQTGGDTPPGPEVPEPGSMLLLGSGLAALVGWRRRRARNS